MVITHELNGQRFWCCWKHHVIGSEAFFGYLPVQGDEGDRLMAMTLLALVLFHLCSFSFFLFHFLKYNQEADDGNEYSTDGEFLKFNREILHVFFWQLKNLD